MKTDVEQMSGRSTTSAYAQPGCVVVTQPGAQLRGVPTTMKGGTCSSPPPRPFNGAEPALESA